MTARRGTHKGEVPEVDMHLGAREAEIMQMLSLSPSGCGGSRGEMEGTEQAQAPTMLWMYKAGRDKIR